MSKDIKNELSVMLKKKLADIDNGKIKAGEDFVVNSKTSSYIPLDMIGLINWHTSRKVEFKE